MMPYEGLRQRFGPASSAVRQPARKIGWVCRGDGFSGIRYIEVKTDEGEDISPILEFREDADRIGASGDLALLLIYMVPVNCRGSASVSRMY